MQESGLAELRPLARSRLLRASGLQPDSERVHFNLGMLAMDEGQGEEAEAHFRRAVELRPGEGRASVTVVDEVDDGGEDDALAFASVA